MLKVHLASCANPDIAGGYWPEGHAGIDEWWEVENLAGAAKAVRCYIADNGLGAGNWSGGEIVDETGRQVARVAYNGRVFEPGSLWYR